MRSFKTTDRVQPTEIEMLVDRQLPIFIFKSLAGRSFKVENKIEKERDKLTCRTLDLCEGGITSKEPTGVFNRKLVDGT